MADQFEIPKRTIENWEAGSRKPPVYVEKLIIEKLESLRKAGK
jgi:DNA-binding transcriptional regulator YiaG